MRLHLPGVRQSLFVPEFVGSLNLASTDCASVAREGAMGDYERLEDMGTGTVIQLREVCFYVAKDLPGCPF